MSATDTRDLHAGLATQAVLAYLQANPGFFTTHPEALLGLTLPHDTGGAISLVERQLQRLREENRALKTQAEAFLASARDNERLIAKIHSLTLSLLGAREPRGLIDLLANGIATELGADRVDVLIFAHARAEAGPTGEFVGRESPRRVPFASLLHAFRIQCGGLDLLQRAALFDDEGFGGSHVLLPLRAEGWEGLLAISSRDPARYDSHLATDFLAFLRDVLTLLLAPWVAPGT